MSLRLLIILIICCRCDEKEENDNDEYEKYHIINSFVVGIAISLLIISCFFNYIFHHYNIYYFSEQSLCLICGIIVGILLKYGKHYYMMHNNSTSYQIEWNGTSNIPEIIFVKTLKKIIKYVPKDIYENTDKDILSSKVLFSPEIFFYLILPPIIFNCGIQMKKKYFFRNIGTIFTMAFIGTAMTIFLFSGFIYLYKFVDKSFQQIGLDYTNSLVFGVIISSTDPVSVLTTFTNLNVNIDLYSIIMGESALNDAVSLIAQRTIHNYIMKYKSNPNIKLSNILESFGMFMLALLISLIIGTLFALLNAIITKGTELNKYPIIETSLFLILSYCSFLITEMVGSVGIVGALFCGIFQANYTLNNLSPEAKLLVIKFIELLCFFFENFVFSYMGISVFIYSHHSWKGGFILWSFIFLLISRAITVYLLCFILNCFRRRLITISFQHVIFLAGLKGAVSFALALENTSSEIRRIFLSTTVIIIIITVIIFGGLFYKFIKILKIETNNIDDVNNVMDDKTYNIDYLYSDVSWFVRKWNYLDRNYFYPFFTRSGPSYKIIFCHIFNKIFGRFHYINISQQYPLVLLFYSQIE